LLRFVACDDGGRAVGREVGGWFLGLVAAGNIFEGGRGDDGEGEEAGGVSGGDGERAYLLLGIYEGSLKSST